MPLENLPPPVAESVTGGMVAALWALIGRLMYRAYAARAGRREFWSLDLVLELPIALGMGAVAKGAAEMAGLTGWGETALIVACAYIGPRAIEVWWSRAQAEKGGKA